MRIIQSVLLAIVAARARTRGGGRYQFNPGWFLYQKYYQIPFSSEIPFSKEKSLIKIETSM